MELESARAEQNYVLHCEREEVEKMKVKMNGKQTPTTSGVFVDTLPVFQNKEQPGSETSRVLVPTQSVEQPATEQTGEVGQTGNLRLGRKT